MMSTKGAEFRRSAERLRFYAAGVLRDLVPWWLCESRLPRLLAEAEAHAGGALLADAAHLAKLEPPASTEGAVAIGSMRPWGQSRYYYDAIEYMRYFGRDRRVLCYFGDTRQVPATPTILKARPIAGENANSVLLNLNKFRLFQTYDDPIPFEEKSPTAVWRGILNHESRRSAVRRWSGDPRHDIGHVRTVMDGFPAKGYLHPLDQLRHRYVVAIEGNDCISNLKWAMASNSVCVMPRPAIETWFMEGRLVPGVHYAEVAADFSDLDAVIEHYEAHPSEARAIVDNARCRVAAFADPIREKYLSLLVLRRYFEATGQWP